MSPEGEDVVKQAFLEKRSIMKKSLFTQENYRKRWFELTRTVLRYSDGTAESGPLREKGRILLNQVKAVEKVDSEGLGRDFTFQVSYFDEVAGQLHTLYVIADTEGKRLEWVTSLREACENCGAFFTQMYHPGVWQRKKGEFTCCGLKVRQSPGCKSTFIVQKNNSDPDKGGPPPIPQRKLGIQVVAIYSYEAMDDQDMSIVKGETYEVLDDAHEHWWKASSRTGETGYIPANYVKKIEKNTLDLYGWYFQGLTRHQSEVKLKEDGREGCFLVRDSSQRDTYTLSVLCNEGSMLVRHYHVKTNDQGKYYFSERHSFDFIPDLIIYHMHNAGGLVTRLRFSPSENTNQPHTAGLAHGKWEIDPSEIEPYIDKQIGKGEFGAVHLAKWKGRILVAVKMMHKDAMSEDSFIEEASTMTQLSHPNLVQLYGVCSRRRPIYIVTEYMKDGSLQQYLHKRRSTLLSQPVRLIDMCLQVCRGMAFLEEKGFLHRDLAARNCLVADELVKVGDFGLARFVLDNEYTSSNGAKFPIRWAAPEVLKFYRFSSYSDIWAFGVLMWEVFTGGDIPYTKRVTNAQVVDMVVDEGRKLERPSHCPIEVYNIMLKCWCDRAEDRYSFKRLERLLTELSENMSGTN